MTEAEDRRQAYIAAHDKPRWLEVVDTDFNRPPRMNEDGELVYFARAFCYEDGTGCVSPGTTVFLHDGSTAVDGTPGLICTVIDVLPEVRHYHHDSLTEGGAGWDDYWRNLHVKPIEWREDTSFA